MKALKIVGLVVAYILVGILVIPFLPFFSLFLVGKMATDIFVGEL